MIYVVDTHALVWHLGGDPNLSTRALAALTARDSQVVVPSIVMVEAWHLYQRKRIKISLQDIRSRMLSAANCRVHPLDEKVLDFLPPGLEMHDAVIVATALACRELLRQPTTLITRDRAITESRLVDVLW